MMKQFKQIIISLIGGGGGFIDKLLDLECL